MAGRFFVDAALDTGQHIQSDGFFTHGEAARCACDLARKMMVEVAIVIDRITGEVRHSYESLNRISRRERPPVRRRHKGG